MIRFIDGNGDRLNFDVTLGIDVIADDGNDESEFEIRYVNGLMNVIWMGRLMQMVMIDSHAWCLNGDELNEIIWRIDGDEHRILVLELTFCTSRVFPGPSFAI